MPDVDYLEMNRIGWDRRVETHAKSAFYDVPGFLAGKTSLREIELRELKGVSGRRLLHLQCHFGLDTLSWARMGAICTGVDLSPAAISYARELSGQAGLEAEFVCSDLYSYRNESPSNDIVFTSYGAVCWLPDLDRWAEIVASNLVSGGTFYMVEFHPIYDLLAGYSYFSQSLPVVEEESTYTENGADVVSRLATWAHPISDVINSLVRCGIQIDGLREHPFSPYDCFEGMEEREPGRYYLQHRENDVPLVYSLIGRKVA
jgi:SAM-dependent methyltransferase